jgi:hypothetical protein
MEEDMTTATLNPVESGAATVIARRYKKDYRIVLAFLGISHVTPYVTWIEYDYEDREGGKRVTYTNGHYFHSIDLVEAVEDYVERR